MSSVCSVWAQQVTPRIAGLEANEEYMSLLREDARLQIREDSINGLMTDMRRRFREDAPNRPQYSKEILSLEEQVFNIRTAKGRLIDRVGAIEQDWVLSNLDSPQVLSQPQPQSVEGVRVRNLVHNTYFREHLSENDYKALREAQRRETAALNYVNRYLANYHDISLLAGMYAMAATEAEANDLFGKYKTLQGVNQVLADSLSDTWNYIFDNKGFAYDYLLDKLGREDILSREERLFSEAMQQFSQAKDEFASDALSDYMLRKRVLLDYEYQMAELLRLDAARDSLRGVTAQFKEFDYRLPKIGVTERYFLEFAPVEFSSAAKYTAANPIPECRVYPRGTIYRILLGTFNAKRAASLFRGAYPLCCLIDEQDKWSYYAGGFASRAEADEAQKKLKSKGFVRPEVVVWRDGRYRNLSRDPETEVQRFRVEIVGVPALPDAVREAIAAQVPEHELSRVAAQMFVVGTFAERGAAETLAAALRTADPALEIKVAEITESPE